MQGLGSRVRCIVWGEITGFKTFPQVLEPLCSLTSASALAGETELRVVYRRMEVVPNLLMGKRWGKPFQPSVCPQVGASLRKLNER